MQKQSQKSTGIIDGLMDYLIEKGEENLIVDVSHDLDDLVKKTRKAEKVVVTSVIAISKEQTDEIRNFIGKTLKLDLPVTNTIDKEIIGGLIIEVGDWVLDASLKAQLQSIKQSLLE